MHDLGKIAVDDAEFVQIAVNVAHYHHEKWNGKGYPEGLKKKKFRLKRELWRLLMFLMHL